MIGHLSHRIAKFWLSKDPLPGCAIKLQSPSIKAEKFVTNHQFDKEFGPKAQLRNALEKAAGKLAEEPSGTTLDINFQDEGVHYRITLRRGEGLVARWVLATVVGASGSEKSTDVGNAGNEAKRDLEFQNQLFERAQRLGDLGHFSHDLCKDTLRWSDNMFALYGVPFNPDDVGMNKFSDSISPKELDAYLDLQSKAVARRDSTLSSTYTIRRQSDGADRIIYTDRSFEYDENGSLITVFGVSQDITDRENTRMERERLHNALQESERTEALNYFAGGLAHELTNLLQPAMTFCSLARTTMKDTGAKKALKQLENVSNAIAQASDVARRALDFVRIQEHENVAYDMNTALEPSRTILGAVGGPNLKFEIASNLKQTKVCVDPTTLLQCLLNLVRNSIEAGGLGTEVVISVDKATFAKIGKPDEFPPGTPCVRIHVSDDGPGIGTDNLKKIFDPLFTTKESGTGLGLLVTRNIIHRWGGEIIARSEINSGTDFFVFIPTCN